MPTTSSTHDSTERDLSLISLLESEHALQVIESPDESCRDSSSVPSHRSISTGVMPDRRGTHDISVVVIADMRSLVGDTPSRSHASSKMRGSGLCSPTLADDTTVSTYVAQTQSVEKPLEPLVPVRDDAERQAPRPQPGERRLDVVVRTPARRTRRTRRRRGARSARHRPRCRACGRAASTSRSRPRTSRPRRSRTCRRSGSGPRSTRRPAACTRRWRSGRGCDPRRRVSRGRRATRWGTGRAACSPRRRRRRAASSAQSSQTATSARFAGAGVSLSAGHPSATMLTTVLPVRQHRAVPDTRPSTQ